MVISSIRVICGGLLAITLPATASAQNQFDAQSARGAITQVVTLDDPAKSYALYLPSQYSQSATGQ